MFFIFFDFIKNEASSSFLFDFYALIRYYAPEAVLLRTNK